MNLIDFFEINQLSHLHDEEKIFFCKTDYLEKDFETISNIKNNVILISGNSDYAITDSIVDTAPKNIKIWYTQNALSNNSILQPIPIGLENELFSVRDGHGLGWGQRVKEKKEIIRLNNTKNITPKKLIYANFTIETNPLYRLPLRNSIQKIEHITWKDPKLSLSDFFNDLYDHKMVLCPVGNGVDTHRLWETLYCNRVPITIKVGNFKIYELYKKLPVIILNTFEELLDKQNIIDQYTETINKKYDYSLLDPLHWKKIIYENRPSY